MGFRYILNPPCIAIWDVAPFSGPLTSLFKLCNWGEKWACRRVQTGLYKIVFQNKDMQIYLLF